MSPMNSKLYKVRILYANSEMWDWCVQTYDKDVWRELHGFVGSSVTFCFDKESDALLFLLRWNK